MQKKTAFWKALNSPFTLWVLSSVLLSSLTFLYSGYQARQRDLREELKRTRQLDTEIEARLHRLAIGLGDFLYWPERFKAALSDVAKPSSAEYPVHVFAEFKDSTLAGLIWELHSLNGLEDKPQLFTAATAAEDLEPNYTIAKSTVDQAKDPKSDPKTRQDIIRVMCATLSARLGNSRESWFEKSLGPLNLPRWGSQFGTPIKELREQCQKPSEGG